MLLAITTEGKIGLGVAAGAFIVFAIVVSFLIPRRNPDFPGERLGLFVAVTALLFVATVGAVVVFAKEAEEGPGVEATETQASTTGEAPAEEKPAAPAGDPAAGEAVFASAGCGGCHTLGAAGASGTVGPNLDESKPTAERAETVVRNGSGAMPAFEGQLDDAEIENVVAYVVQSTQG